MEYRASPIRTPLVIVASSVTAIDRESGATRWTYELTASPRRFVVHEQWVIVLDRDGVLHCLELLTGVRAGLVHTQLPGANAFLFDGERFYVSNDRNVVALDWNGAELWRSDVPFNRYLNLGGMAIDGLAMQPDYADG